jgi:hypothetical protein
VETGGSKSGFPVADTARYRGTSRFCLFFYKQDSEARVFPGGSQCRAAACRTGTDYNKVVTEVSLLSGHLCHLSATSNDPSQHGHVRWTTLLCQYRCPAGRLTLFLLFVNINHVIIPDISSFLILLLKI